MKKYFTKNEAGEFEEIEVDDAVELKTALAKEREESKAAKQKAKELEELRLKLEEDKMLKEKEFEIIANKIADVLDNIEDESLHVKIKEEMKNAFKAFGLAHLIK